MPFVALTSTASAGMCGAAARITARSPCEGTATMTWRAPARRLGQRRDGPKGVGKRDVGQVSGIGAARRHFVDEVRVAAPQRDVMADARQMNRERRAPTPGAKHGGAVGRGWRHAAILIGPKF